MAWINSVYPCPLLKRARTNEFVHATHYYPSVTILDKSAMPFEEERIKLYTGNQLIFENGMPATISKENLTEVMKGKGIRIRLELGLGSSQATIWTCDLSHDYITINAEYHT